VLRAALLFGVPLVPHQLAGWVLELSDRAVLERYVPLSALGIYAVGYQVGLVMSVLATSANGAFAPYMYAADAEHGAEESGRRVARLATYYALALSAAAAALFTLSGDVVRLLASPAFADAEAVARPVVLGQLAAGLYYVPTNLLFLRHRTAVLPLITGSAAAANIGLNLWAVPRFGYVAAAWTTLVAYLLMLAAAHLAASRTAVVRYEWRRLAVVGAALAATVAVGQALAGLRGPGGVALRLVAIGLFPAVIWLGRFAGPSERAALRLALRRATGGVLALRAQAGRRAP
jgi:O-antigen/teichoic acid export membrane protein